MLEQGWQPGMREVLRLCIKKSPTHGKYTTEQDLREVRLYLNMEMCFKISPDVFRPKPKVESAIIRFTKNPSPIIPYNKYIKFNKIVKTAFSKRRKMLRNSLNDFDIPISIQEEIDFTRRPETLSIEEFAKLL